MKRAGLRARLEALLASYDFEAHRRDDPVSFVHRYTDRDDVEIVALLAALLAFGNVVSIRRSIARALDRLDGEPAAVLARAEEPELCARFDGFVHRVYRGEHIARLLHRAKVIRTRDGSLGASFTEGYRRAGFREALGELADRLRGPNPTPSMRHLVPDPAKGSACKRLLLFSRWMIRPADGVDLGLWDVPPRALVIPVDTHILRIAHNLGLTERTDASWRTAETITERLRAFDPDDPVKYDFALCHLGISRRCPSRRDRALCAPCVLRPSCRHHRRRR